MLAQRNHRGGGHDEEREDYDRPVTETYEGGRAAEALRLDLEPAFGELRQRRQHAAVAIDRRGNAGVGGREVGTAGLDGAQPRDLQVLRGRERVAEPGHIGHVDQYGCLRRAPADLVAESVLVADVG